MPTRRKVEIFTAGCPVCDEAVKELEMSLGGDCEIIVYDLNKGCENNVCRAKEKAYGIKSVPAVAIDGQLASCCSDRGIDMEDINRQCGVA